MDALGKLLKKRSRKERAQLLEFLESIRDPTRRKHLDMKKLSGSDVFRARKGDLRVLFHMEGDRGVVDAIRIRNEKTYRDV